MSVIGDRLKVFRVLMKEDFFDDRTVQGVVSGQCGTEWCVITGNPWRLQFMYIDEYVDQSASG